MAAKIKGKLKVTRPPFPPLQHLFHLYFGRGRLFFSFPQILSALTEDGMASLVNENLSQILNGKTINEAEGGIFFSDVL